jgi:glucokinase
VNPKLVVAIDGENVAFGLVDADGGAPRAVRMHKTADFPTFTDALQAYLRENHLAATGLALGLAVAGVARGDTISLANCRWYVSVSGLKSFFGTAPLILNDFESIAWSLPGLDAAAIKPVGARAPGAIGPGRRFLVVGTGSGLGVAVLVTGADGGVRVFASEGGHGSFAPQDEQEDALLVWLRARHGHVSFERLLAGVGLRNIHGWLAANSGRTAGPGPAAETIANAALRGDALAAEAARMFARIFGGFVGNVVLTAGTFDGVFLVSPLLGTLLPFLADDGFRAAMTGKGRLRKMLEPVPVGYAEGRNPRLRGMAAALDAARPAAVRA